MSVRVLLVVFLSAVVANVAVAQTAPDAPAAAEVEIDGGTPKYIREETPEQRRTRVGRVDPGLTPDPEQVFERNGRRFHIRAYDRQWAAFDAPEGYVRPFAMVNFAYEIYQLNDRWVWVWFPTADEMKENLEQKVQTIAEKESGLTQAQIEYLNKFRDEFYEVNPPASTKVVRFEDSSEGLPSQGSWRHSAAFGDMNGDGHIDIIAPPERGARSVMPAIFLGDGKGKWSPWAAAVWPYGMDYGNVVTGDFNRDGKLDLAFGMHLIGPRVLLNNGDGRFIDASEGMTDSFPTRRVVAADVDNDGDLDLLALYEGPSRGQQQAAGRVRAYINDGKASKWSVVEAAGVDTRLAGDWLAIGKFNNDRYPDFVSSNNAFHGTEVLYRTEGAKKWAKVETPDGHLVPYYSIYTAVAAGPFTSKKLDDAVLSYRRVWPDADPTIIAQPPLKTVVGVDRISFQGKQPVRVPIMRFEGARPISGMASADFDGDGKLDLLFTRFEPREAVLLLGDGKGGFRRATIDGLTLADNPNYDVNVADVNGDGRPDILLLYESTTESAFGRQNGSMKLFLNRGASPIQPAE